MRVLFFLIPFILLSSSSKFEFKKCFSCAIKIIFHSAGNRVCEEQTGQWKANFKLQKEAKLKNDLSMRLVLGV